MNKSTMEAVGAAYVRENFAPKDRLAVVLLDKRSGSVLQRLATAEHIAQPEFQDWLRHKNGERYDIYLSMNALREDAKGRTKNEVALIRHVFLDLDHNGTSNVERLLKRPELPKPNHLINTSPDKWQVVWRVEAFTKDQAEELQRALVPETGADPAATDCSRVLRLPGFYNHKYARVHLVGTQKLTDEIYTPERFPRFLASRRTPSTITRPARSKAGGHAKPAVTQSELDWAFAKRALARGESETTVIAAISTYRRFDKHNPAYYAELTVRKASEALRVSARPGPNQEPER